MAVIYKLNKPLGLTPLQALDQLRKFQLTKLENKKLTYAGRLDPMAEGLLLILESPNQSTKQKYLNLDKTYQFRILFGVSTDTYDILGLVQPARRVFAGNKPSRSDLEGILPQCIGTYPQPYPPYSSKTVKGKPLFHYARTNQLSKITIPKKKINIESLKLIKSESISKQKLEAYILQSIKLVSGDFRQPKIIKSWQQFFSTATSTSFPVFTLELNCSSGTYVRSLVQRIAKKLNSKAVTLSIKRTKVGPYLLSNATSLN